MRLLTAAFIVIASFAAAAPAEIEIEAKEPNAYTHLNVRNNPRDFQFAIISDRTGGERAGKFREGVRKINLLHPEFVMSVGDGIEGYTENLEQMHREWDELDAIMSEFDAPFFYVPGNHDISNAVMLEEWQKRYGSPFYHFRYQDVLFIILNSEDPPPKQLSDDQLAFIESTLQEHDDVRWTLFFMHVPLWGFDHPTNWEKVEAMIADRPYTVFAGHTHNYMKTERQGRRYIVLATTGGGSQLLGPANGTFDQVAWVTMTDEGPVLANLFLNGIWNENVRTPEVVGLVRPLEQGLALQTSPIHVEDETFARGTSTVTLANPADRPMLLEAWVHTPPGVAVTPTFIRRELSGKENATVELRIEAATALPWLAMAAPHIEYRMVYDVEGREPLEYRLRHQLLVDGPISCAPVDATVDGELKEWPGLRLSGSQPAQIDHALHSWQGTGDGSFRFDAGYDDEFVYIAVHVSDDDLLFREREEAFRKDGIEIRLDARPAEERRERPARDSNDPENDTNVLMLGVSLSGDDNETTLYKRDHLPEGVQATAARVEGGYVVEAAVPVSYLNDHQGGDWEDFRLNVTQYDYDDGYSYPRVTLWWRPNWNSIQDYPESGTFVRN